MNKRLAALIILSLAMVIPGAAQVPVSSMPRMQEIIRHSVAAEGFMGSVLVVRDGVVMVDQGYGSADLEWKIPNSPAVRFRLGSLTKQFTAAGILLLEERGKLKVEDPVSKYVPNAPAAWAKISIFNLLTHTSGISNFTSFPEYQPTEWKDTTPEELVARFRNKPLDFEPGAKFSYSNSGYVLLGYILEKVSGQKYGEFLQANIFTPLGMADTGLDENRAILPGRAQGYTAGAQGLIHAGYVSMTIPFSAGALYSSTADLLKWEGALFGGKVLGAASLKKMTTPFKDGYGFGVAIDTRDGHRSISHSGGIEGFATFLAYYPEDKLTVVVLANSDSSRPGALANELATLALGGQVTLAAERTEVPVDVATLHEYAGVYRLTPSFALTMTVEDGRLMTEATGQPKLPLFAESPTKFFLKVVDAQVEFARNPKSKTVTGLTLYQNGAVIKGVKE